LIFFTKNQI